LLSRSLAPVSAAPGIEIKNSILTVTTNTLAISFREEAMISLKNLLTGEEYIRQAGANWFNLSMLAQDAPTLRASAWRLSTDPNTQQPTAVIDFQDATHSASLTVGIDQPSGEIFLRIEGKSRQAGVISLQWGIQGLDLAPGRLVIPGQAGTYFDLRSAPNLIGLDYPVHWESQMVVYEHNQGGLSIYARDPKPYFKRLHASRQTGSLDLGFETFAVAPWANATETPTIEWRMKGFAGDWRNPASQYRDWIRSLKPLVPASGNRAWVRGIRAVVTIQTLDLSVLEPLAGRLEPSQTLLYLVDWRRDSFDINYPDYTPSPQSKPFVDRARDLGFRVMLHTNLLGVSANNPDYQGLKAFQLKYADSLEPIGWLWDLPEGNIQRVAYISPASEEYRRLLIARLRPALEGLRPDAIHMDGGGVIINDGNGPIGGLNSAEGLTRLYQELLQAFPDLTLSAESMNEIVAPYNWVAQRWNSESPPHPISTFLMGDQVTFYGFLDQPYPDEPDFTEYLKRYEGQGVLPTLTITSPSDLGADRVQTLHLLDQLRLWQRQGFAPDWNSDWGDSIFRFRSADATSSATVEGFGNIVRLNIDNETFYQRVRDTDQVETPYFIRYWPAYDDSKLYGLDPTRQYWLDPVPQRPIGLPHLTELPPDVKVGAGTLVTPDYAYFELETAERQAFDFVSAFWDAKRGTLFNKKEYPLIYGARAEISRLVVGGELRNSVLFMPPPWGAVNGATFVEYVVPVPAARKVTFKFETGLSDGAVNSDGALFAIQLDGQTVWQKTIYRGGWNEGSLDLSAYAGRSVRIRLITHPGLNLNPVSDLACWSGLSVVPDLSRPNSSLQVALPERGQPIAVSGEARLQSAQDRSAVVGLDIPGRFVMFLKPGPSAVGGQSLLDLPHTVWKAGYNGIPSPIAYERSGEIETVSSGGVVKRRAIVADPPRNGFTILSWAVSLPPDATDLLINAGLANAPPPFPPDVNYSGTDFIIQINGQRLWEKELRIGGWNEVKIDLSPWRGQNILIQLITDSERNATFDWARWADLEIRAESGNTAPPPSWRTRVSGKKSRPITSPIRR
jgi:hypothetical protein